MAVNDLLQIRQKEHEALLQKLQTLLQADQRIVAAWLFGSAGRYISDTFSDLDLRVIVKDEYIEAICAERQSYAARPDQPALLLESPGNAPAEGAYLQEEWRVTTLPPVQDVEQIALLRRTAQEMEHLTSAIELIVGQVPSQVIPYVYSFFDLANILI